MFDWLFGKKKENMNKPSDTLLASGEEWVWSATLQRWERRKKQVEDRRAEENSTASAPDDATDFVALGLLISDVLSGPEPTKDDAPVDHGVPEPAPTLPASGASYDCGSSYDSGSSSFDSGSSCDSGGSCGCD